MSDDTLREPGEDPVAALEARLGLRFADRALALDALTHKSYVNEHRGDALTDNERLEFLGDAVVDLAVSHRLMERFPAAREGDLSKMRAAVVDETGLSEMARGLELGELLRLGRGEELTGGRKKASLLADAMEAVIGALFLGGGLDPVLALVDRFLGEAFRRAAAGTLDRDFKTQLQELAQSRLRATPRYRVVAEHGPDHSKTFEVELELKGELLGRGLGRSKKDAEQASAKHAMDELSRRFEAEGAPVLRQARDEGGSLKEPPVREAEAHPAPAAAPEPPAEAPQAGPEPERTEPAPRPRPRKKPAVRTARAASRARTAAGKPAARTRKPAAKPAARASRRGTRPKR